MFTLTDKNAFTRFYGNHSAVTRWKELVEVLTGRKGGDIGTEKRHGYDINYTDFFLSQEELDKIKQELYEKESGRPLPPMAARWSKENQTPYLWSDCIAPYEMN